MTLSHCLIHPSYISQIMFEKFGEWGKLTSGKAMREGGGVGGYRKLINGVMQLPVALLILKFELTVNMLTCKKSAS